LLHLVQMDYFQHRGGLDGSDVKPALARVDAHIAAVTSALREAGIAAQTTVIVTGDHGFQDVRQWVQVNEILARAGLGGCPWSAPDWRATAHVAGGSAAVFVSAAAGPEGATGGAGDAGGAGADPRAEEALRREARDRYTIVTRRELDGLGALPGAAFALEAAPGWAIAGECGKGVETPGRSGTHGFLPSRPSMNTGFIASGAGVRSGVVLERIGLVDVAPTAARLLGLTMTNVEGRVLTEILP
jgi:arylsulfatase A-like enzyme